MTLGRWLNFKEVVGHVIHHRIVVGFRIGMMLNMVLFGGTKRFVAMIRHSMTVGMLRHRRRKMASVKGEALSLPIIRGVIDGMMKLRC